MLLLNRALTYFEKVSLKTSSSETVSYISEAPALLATKPKTVKPKSIERARKVGIDVEAAAVQLFEGEHNTEATAKPAP